MINLPIGTGESAVSSFTFDGHEIRLASIDGEPWFVAADVCRALGFKPHHKGGFHNQLRHIDPNHVTPAKNTGVTWLRCLRRSRRARVADILGRECEGHPSWELLRVDPPWGPCQGHRQGTFGYRSGM